MAAKKKIKAKTLKHTKPSATAMAAAKELLSVPEMMAATAEVMKGMVAQLDQMEKTVAQLASYILATHPKGLLTEPLPLSSGTQLLQENMPPASDTLPVNEEFKHEPKGNIP